MTTRNLDKLFKPESVAVIGATNRPLSVGKVVMANLLQGGFDGPIMPVNPGRQAVSGVLTYKNIDSLPIAPDLGIICTPPKTVPGLIQELGDKGTRAVIVLTAGLNQETDETGRTIQQAMLDAAESFRMRILGPNCLGLMVPGIGLNAGFAHLPALPGKIAFVSQSGALCTAVLDWARAHGIGFSHFISLGDCAELDFGDVIDYLGSDPDVRAILLYIESIHQRRNFMSASRAAARNKPILVIKSGRHAEGAAAAASHTGALAGSDDVYDAAIRRAGMLRVNTVTELFAAVQTLARARPMKGDNLAIMTNGGGIGVMAVDDLMDNGGQLAEISESTIEKLNEVLPATWSHGNPVDIIGDAPGSRYAAAIDILSKAKEVDALLVMHAPTATANSTEAAEAIIEVAKKTKCNMLTNWVGEEAVGPGRHLFEEAGIPTFRTPGAAVGAFMHMVHYRQNQEMLMVTPPSVSGRFTADFDAAKKIVDDVMASGRDMMTEAEAKAMLTCYGIPTVETHVVASPKAAEAKSREMEFPVALKIHSKDISHKSDAGGVELFIESPEAVRTAAEAMLKRVSANLPDAKIEGFTVQRMAIMPHSQELIVGVTTDHIFGPVILFGQGGTSVEVVGDRTIGLPPLNMSLARDMISRTRVSKLLKGYRDVPPADMNALSLTLIQVSQMLTDFRPILELDINPLLANHTGVLAVDARIRVGEPELQQGRRLAIRPYPKHLEEPFVMPSGREVVLRPIRPEDEPEHMEFHAKLSEEDIRFRHFGMVKFLPHSEMARFTQIDYDREMAFIASAPLEKNKRETIGVVRAVTDPNNERAEFAVVVRSDLKGQRLGRKLLEKIIDYCRARGTGEIAGQVLSDNKRMLKMTEKLGFKRHAIPGEDVVEIVLKLQ